MDSNFTPVFQPQTPPSPRPARSRHATSDSTAPVSPVPSGSLSESSSDTSPPPRRLFQPEIEDAAVPATDQVGADVHVSEPKPVKPTVHPRPSGKSTDLLSAANNPSAPATPPLLISPPSRIPRPVRLETYPGRLLPLQTPLTRIPRPKIETRPRPEVVYTHAVPLVVPVPQLRFIPSTPSTASPLRADTTNALLGPNGWQHKSDEAQVADDATAELEMEVRRLADDLRRLRGRHNALTSKHNSLLADCSCAMLRHDLAKARAELRELKVDRARLHSRLATLEPTTNATATD